MSQTIDTRSDIAHKTSDALLRVAALSYAYPGGAGEKVTARQVVTDISLSLSPAEIVCLIGPSGCGKTTLLNLLAGLLTPTGGRIAYEPAAGANGHSARRIGYIFQQDPLLPWRTVKKNLLLVAEIRKMDKAGRFAAEQRMRDYLSAFHLKSEHLDLYPAQLSGGMRQRVSIIQSLLFDPQILLLDEPFSALDFFTKSRLETEFQNMVKSERKAAIMVTHDIEEAIAMADRVLLMNRSGVICHEYKIDFAPQTRVSPEEARGLPKFAEHYSVIWSDLKAVMDQ